MLEGLTPAERARLDAIRARPGAERDRRQQRDLSESKARLSLTRRHRQVLELIAEGLPDKTIAARLHISEATVKTHVKKILARLEADNRTHAVTLAFRRGLLV